VQEVVLASCAVVFCGDKSLPWDVVEKVFGTLAAHGLLEFFPQKSEHSRWSEYHRDGAYKVASQHRRKRA
jgi:hypothetical protein